MNNAGPCVQTRESEGSVVTLVLRDTISKRRTDALAALIARLARSTVTGCWEFGLTDTRRIGRRHDAHGCDLRAARRIFG